jgi:hypothetical protein
MPMPTPMSWTIRLALPLAAILAIGTGQARTLSSKVTELDQIPRMRAEYKVPEEPNQLFYIERSSNSNTVVYAANLDSQGAIDRNAPVDAFWRWYNVDGHKKPLNFWERKMAYGVTAGAPNKDGSIPFKVAALPERQLTMTLDDKKRPQALIRIGGHSVRLSYVYLEVVDGGLMPSIPSLDIFGTDIASGKAIHEHIVQN